MADSINEVLMSDLDNIVIEGLNIIKINARRPSRIISSPIEDGNVRFDNKVVDPMRINIDAIINVEYADKVIDKLKSMRNSREMKFCMVLDKFDLYENLSVEDFTTDSTSEMFDATKVNIKLIEVKVTSSTKGSVYCGNKGFIPS